MAKSSTEPAVQIANFGLGEPIVDANYASVAQGGHYVWERTGTIFLAHAFRPLFKITSTSYTQTTAETSDYAEGLESFYGSGIALRRVESGGNVRTAIELTVHGRNIDVRLNIVSQGAGSSTNAVASCGATWERATAVAIIDPASYDYAGENDIYVYAEAKVPASGTGYIAALTAAELIASTAYLPRGR
jgi:hypothetical protein